MESRWGGMVQRRQSGLARSMNTHVIHYIASIEQGNGANVLMRPSEP